MSSGDGYVWTRCRTKHSSGPSPWEYVEYYRDAGLTDEQFLREVAEDFAAANDTHCEHFRGAEAEFHTPPIDHVLKEIREYEARIAALQRTIARLREYTLG